MTYILSSCETAFRPRRGVGNGTSSVQVFFMVSYFSLFSNVPLTFSPPKTYISFPMAADASPLLLVGIGFNSVQLLFLGSYTSVLLKFESALAIGSGIPSPYILPPMTYSFPLTTDEVRWCLAVGIGAFSAQVSVVGSYA